MASAVAQHQPESQQRPRTQRVIVVGAGPAGASLAFLLARRGVEVILLERQTDFAREFRGEVLLPGGLEALHQMGLASELDSVPHVTLERVEIYVNGRPRVRAGFDPETFGPLAPRWMSQPGLLELLVAKAGAHPSFRLERGATVRNLVHADGRCVGVRVLGAAGERELRADLVVGADGRSSVVRRRAELREDRDATPMDVVWCKLPLPEYARRDRVLRGYLGGGHLLLAAPIYDGRLQIAWVIRKGSFGELQERGMPACLEEMAKHVSPDLAEHLRRHAHDAVEPFLLWTVSDRVRDWTAPGLLVIGDAAHTMSPVGAQGINIALRDALVAANHLVPALLATDADPAALDAACRRVQAEREPEVAAIQRLQARAPRILLNRAWWARGLLWILPLLVGPDPLRGRGGAVFRRIAFGTTEVKLVV
jgi:2-polyprenyl-6-methoxyphenol hydroxylase-like FAD-dependent oxidoreductase